HFAKGPHGPYPRPVPDLRVIGCYIAGDLRLEDGQGKESGRLDSTTMHMKGMPALGALFAFVGLMGPYRVHAQELLPGNVDTSFDPGTGVAGPTGPALVAVQSNGKVIVAGGHDNSFEGINGVTVTNLARLNTNGSVDTTFQGQIRFGGSAGSV